MSDRTRGRAVPALEPRETVVSDTPSAGGPLLGPEATDHAMIQLEPGRPTHPRPLGSRRPQGIWVAWESGQSVLVGVGREGWSQPLTLQGWASWADDCRAGALVAVPHLCLTTACQHADHGTLLRESCLPQFQAHMEAVGRTLWCDWGKTIR